jgi:phage minor structural protein
MIKIFSSTDKIFSSNGDKVILPTKAKVHKEDNGPYYLDLECSLDYINYIISGNIIVADTPQGDQAFRISSVTKTRTKITAKCYHVFYDSENLLIQDTFVVNKDCNDALDQLNSATSDTSPFTTVSNITGINSYRCVRNSLYEAIQTVIERWGGHLVRDNFTIKVMGSIGQDNGVTIRYAKNLKSITCAENWDNVVTKILPVGKDGILLNYLDSSAEVYVSSTTQYEIPYTKTITFEQDIDQEDFDDTDDYYNALLEDLQIQAQQYVNDNCVPKLNYTLKANVEKLTDIGDIIQVIDERLGLSLETNVISFDYDCILKKYTQLEFGNFTQKLSGLMNTIQSTTQTTVTEAVQEATYTLQSDLQESYNQIIGTLGSSYCIYEGDKILIVDSIPKETATNVIMINNGGIGFSQAGINGPFQSAWTIDNVLNMEQINVINLTANLIKGGTLKLGSNLNQNGNLEVYDTSNNLIVELNNNGLKMYGQDGSYILMNNESGFTGYDRLGNQIYWVTQDEFHMKKSVIEEEITMFNKMRYIPITITDTNNNIVNDGIGLVSVAGGD